MKKLLFSAFAILCFFTAGCENADIGMAIGAAVDAIRAATLDDEDVARLALELSQHADRTHTVAPPENPHARRLRELTAGHRAAGGERFDFKVYLSPEVNAFAMADGSIRIYSGLMEAMDDGELMFVVGHEMGHVVERHSKKKLRLAYVGSAVRKAVASQRNEAGMLARSAVGALAESLLNAQYSQKEERAADDYGVTFLKDEGYDPRAAVSALEKLAADGKGHSFLSTHPAPEARAERLRKNGLSPAGSGEPSFFKRFLDWLAGLWPF